MLTNFDRLENTVIKDYQSRVMPLLDNLGPKSKELIQRAALTYANLVSSGGDLQVKQVKGWWNMALGVDPYDRSSVFTRVDTKAFAGPTGERLDWFTTSQGHLRKHTEKTAESHRAELDTDKRTISPVRTKMLFDPTYEFVKKSVEEDPTGVKLVATMSVVYRNDLANLFWNGDTDSTNASLSIYDGIVKKVKDATHYTNINRVHSDAAWTAIDSTSANIATILRDLYVEIATLNDGQYANDPRMRFIMSNLNKFRYWEYLKDKGVNSDPGYVKEQDDGVLTPENFAGIPIVAEPWFPNDIVIATIYPNLAFRYNEAPESLLIESERKINEQYILFVLSNEHNCEIAWEPAVFANYHS